MVKSIFNKYDDFVFEAIDNIFTRDEVYQEYYSRTFEGDFFSLIQNNNLPELSYWFDYFFIKNKKYHPTFKNSAKEEILQFWDQLVAEFDTYRKLENRFKDEFDYIMFPDFYNDVAIEESELTSLLNNHQTLLKRLALIAEKRNTERIEDHKKLPDFKAGELEKVNEYEESMEKTIQKMMESDIPDRQNFTFFSDPEAITTNVTSGETADEIKNKMATIENGILMLNIRKTANLQKLEELRDRYILENGTLHYHRELEKLLVKYGHRWWDDLCMARQEGEMDRNYDPGDGWPWA
jgi:hypothetical protein